MNIVRFFLSLDEPVLASAPGGDPNTSESQPFIPGNALRGALARRYLHAGGVAEDEAFQRLFLDGRIRFLNAYPAGQYWARTLPTPRAWVQEKDPPQDRIGRLYNRAASGGEIMPARGPRAISRPFFEMASDEEARFLEPDLEIAVHTARNRRMGRAIKEDAESALFRYRALAPGQRFSAAILVDSGETAAADETSLRRLLQDGALYLGGSQTAGYGHTTAILDDEKEGFWPDLEHRVTGAATGDLVAVYLASDGILRDRDTGQATNNLLAVLPRELDTRLEEAGDRPHTFSRFGWDGGFNSKWGLPLPQEWTVRAGSVWLFRARETITADDLRAVEEAGVGGRRPQGYGRILFNPPWLANAERLGRSEPVRIRVTTTSPAPLALRAVGMLQRLNQRLVEKELDQLVVVAAHKIVAREPRGRLSRSQIARLRLRLRRDDDSFTSLQRYLEGTHQRKSADEQFRRFFLRAVRPDKSGHSKEVRLNFREWLTAIVREPASVWDEILPSERDWQPPRVGDYEFPREDPEFTYQYAVRYLDAVCEQLAKRMGQND